LEVCELKLDKEPLDLTEPQQKKRLFELMNVEATSTIEKLGGIRGGQNLGIWLVRDSCDAPQNSTRDLIVKVVNLRSGLRSGEGERFLALASNYPNIMEDTSLAFPTKIVRCSVGDEIVQELIVIPKVQGESFSDFIGKLWWSKDANAKSDVFRAMKLLGRQLREFHTCYDGAQHGDFQPGNIFYDRSTNAFTFIDLADVGPQFTRDNDVQHFHKALSNFSVAYGPVFEQQSRSCFDHGYNNL
jgi:hypothetical protein